MNYRIYSREKFSSLTRESQNGIRFEYPFVACTREMLDVRWSAHVTGPFSKIHGESTPTLREPHSLMFRCSSAFYSIITFQLNHSHHFHFSLLFFVFTLFTSVCVCLVLWMRQRIICSPFLSIIFLGPLIHVDRYFFTLQKLLAEEAFVERTK